MSDLQSSEGDLNKGTDEVPLLGSEHVLEVGHDGGVHARQAVRPVDSHHELGALALGRHALRHQQVPVATSHIQFTVKLVVTYDSMSSSSLLVLVGILTESPLVMILTSHLRYPLQLPAMSSGSVSTAHLW